MQDDEERKIRQPCGRTGRRGGFRKLLSLVPVARLQCRRPGELVDVLRRWTGLKLWGRRCLAQDSSSIILLTFHPNLKEADCRVEGFSVMLASCSRLGEPIEQVCSRHCRSSNLKSKPQAAERRPPKQARSVHGHVLAQGSTLKAFYQWSRGAVSLTIGFTSSPFYVSCSFLLSSIPSSRESE